MVIRNQWDINNQFIRSICNNSELANSNQSQSQCHSDDVELDVIETKYYNFSNNGEEVPTDRI